MNLDSLKKKLQPKLHAFEIEGEKIYIHRPTASDINKCTDVASTLVLCTKDENGDPIFSTEDIEGRINVSIIDASISNSIYTAINKLFESENQVDEIEKK
ncbi:MAG: hypothetical protein K0S95_751 [Pantoea eucrina]|jgi:hypothetical protein|nr:hypothetical protein [Pantoea eucrina]